MPATTPNGLPYPVGTDLVRDGDDAIRDLALAVDHRDWTAETATPTIAANASVNVAFTFPVGWFTAAPLVVAGSRGSSTMLVTVGSATTSGVAATARNITTSPTTGYVVIQAMRRSTT